MDTTLKDRFSHFWDIYFPGAELPITLYYTDDATRAECVPAPRGHVCFVAQLAGVRNGRPRAFNVDSLGCPGGKRYLGFSQELMPNFEYFLSCGIPGKLEGERYKKSPEIVRELIEKDPAFVAPASYAVFKRWDQLEPEDAPELVIFFAPPDVLSGLYTLAGFDMSELEGVIAPFCAGCGAIVQQPYMQKDQTEPRAVLGMFDVSARPYVQKDLLTFTVPMGKFVRMMDDVQESFLTTPSWERVKKRIREDCC
ncbi:MAG TPA: DUF169 domain-containing protein [Candidatus Hydrogenedentes bacterium]|nr:DUF169 domain-containing protein [Candidatus Hydrogenedentota bacterium]